MISTETYYEITYDLSNAPNPPGTQVILYVFGEAGALGDPASSDHGFESEYIYAAAAGLADVAGASRGYDTMSVASIKYCTPAVREVEPPE